MVEKTVISVVVPAYNEEDVIGEFHRRVSAVLNQLPMRSEIVYVNDGSHDETLNLLIDLQSTDERVTVVDLSRNFGKEIALTAGLDYASGEGIIPIDADLQDPPELIPKLIEKWHEGFDVVFARRISRAGESYVKKATAGAFYKLMQLIGGNVSIPDNVGDFRLIDRKALDALKQMREQHRFMKVVFGYRVSTNGARLPSRPKVFR